MSNSGRRARLSRIRGWVACGALALYVPVIVLSTVYALRAERAREVNRAQASRVTGVLVDTALGRAPVPVRIGYNDVRPTGEQRGNVLMLHGTPGLALNFDLLAPLIAEQGYRVISIDRPGFGDSSRDLPNLSASLQSRAAAALLMQLGVESVHVIGWSNGGPIALEMAGNSPVAVESVTLLAATAMQETEGSGGYYFEQAKYRVGQVALGAVYYLFPHFGALPRDFVTWIRDFTDSDLRASGLDLRSLATPILVLQGRHDFLVKDWAGERHHAAAPRSRLVVYDGDHFAPFMAPEAITPHILAFMDAARTGDEAGMTGELILAPRVEHLGWIGARFREFALWLPWYVELLLIALAAWRSRRASLAVVALWVAGGTLDIGVAIVGAALGAAVRAAMSSTQNRFAAVARASIGDALMVPVLRVIAGIFAGLVVPALSWPGLFISFVALATCTHILPAPWTRRSRQRFLAWFRRLRKYEYWPAYVFYAPPMLYAFARSLTRSGPGVVTRCNPAISHGGGVISETKSEVLGLLRDAGAPVLPFEFVPADDDADRRASRALGAITERSELGGFPIVCKPDSGMRGYAMRIARDEHDLRAYVRDMPRDFVIQRYHAGPHECAVFWARDPSRENAGRIFSITRKEFPFLVGDGRRSVEELIRSHPRFRCQAEVYCERLADKLKWEPERGERVPLVRSGNHAQGAIFRDGADLVTPELERAFSEIALSIPARDGRPGGFDIGRFDVRYEDEAELRAGRNLGIVELNGVTSESTNIYDPARSVWWAWGITFRHARLLVDIGAWRRSLGYPPMTLGDLVRAHREHHGGLPDLHVAD